MYLKSTPSQQKLFHSQVPPESINRERVKDQPSFPLTYWFVYILTTGKRRRKTLTGETSIVKWSAYFCFFLINVCFVGFPLLIFHFMFAVYTYFFFFFKNVPVSGKKWPTHRQESRPISMQSKRLRSSARKPKKTVDTKEQKELCLSHSTAELSESAAFTTRITIQPHQPPLILSLVTMYKDKIHAARWDVSLLHVNTIC